MNNIHWKASFEKLNQILITHERRMASIGVNHDHFWSSYDSLVTKGCQHYAVQKDKNLVKAEGIPLQQRISEIMKNIHWKESCKKLNQIHFTHQRRMASIEIHQDYSWSSYDSLGTKVCQYHGVPNDKDLVKAEGIPLQ